MKIQIYGRCGFTLVEIMIILAILGLLVAIGVPNYVQASRASQTKACIGNLRKIDGAKVQWALEMNKATSETPDRADLAPYFGRGGNGSLIGIYCPLSGLGALNGYLVNAVDTPPQCNNYNISTHPGQLD